MARSNKKTAPIKVPGTITKKQSKKKTAKKAAKKTVKKAAKKASKRAAPKNLTQHRGREKRILSKKNANTDRIVPDTSILIEGALSRQLNKAAIKIKEIIIPEAVLAELEAQANRKKETGYLGLDEIEELTKIGKAQKFTVSFKGARPEEFEIKYAKSGEMDRLIRVLAEEEGATLYTADVVQAKVARTKGIPVILHRYEYEKPQMEIEGFFDDTTMSVHIKEDTPITAKRGAPGEWEFTTVREALATRAEIQRWSKQILDSAHTQKDGFVEIERKGSTILQVGRYRIVITRPPFSDGHEITAVRPVKKLSFEEYNLSEKLRGRVDEQAEGILIAGAPGHGKSTFAQALAEHYAKQEKIIKTIEAPRDMTLAPEIAQYAISHGSAEEVHDILLLSRPDYTIFDEMRNTDDFKLFADMRLSGVGMIGVMHATQTIDAIQRFLGRIELGVIPHVIDTVIFIKDGAPDSVYAISITVKVPSGMTEADLARPIVEVHDFENGKLVYEIYTFGEQTVVMPVGEGGEQQSVHKFAQEGLRKFFSRYADNPSIEVKSNNKVVVTVDDQEVPKLIGKKGEHIQRLEEELGMSIDVQKREGKKGSGPRKKGLRLDFGVHDTKTSLILELGRKRGNQTVDIYADGEFLLTAHASKKGQVKLAKRNKMTKFLIDALEEDAVDVFQAT